MTPASSGEPAKKITPLIHIPRVRVYSGAANIALCRNSIGRLIIRTSASSENTMADIDAVDLLRWFKGLTREDGEKINHFSVAPLENTYASIQSALNGGAKWIAIVQALTLPEICSALELIQCEADQITFSDWYKKYLHSSLPLVTPEVFLQLRSSVLEKVKTVIEIECDIYSKVVFFMETEKLDIIINPDENGIYYIECRDFCESVINASRKWYRDNRNNAIVINNVTEFYKIRDMHCPQLSDVVILR